MTDVWLIVKEVDGGVIGRPVLASLTAGTVPGHTSGGEVIETRRAVVGTAFTLPATSEIVPSGCWWTVSTGAHTWNVQLDANDPGTEGAPHLVGEPGIQVAAGTAPPTWDPSPVDSVNAKIGAVTLTAADVGAATPADVSSAVGAEASTRGDADTALGGRIDDLDSDKAAKASNLSDLTSSSAARTNLGLGTAAVLDVPPSGNASGVQVVKGDDTRLAKPSSIVQHTWAKDGTSGWTQQLISADGVHAPNTLSVVSGRGRVASAVTDTPTSYRECWLRDGTEWADSEVRSVFYPPSAMDSTICTPQMGHVHRGSSVGGIVVDTNISANAFEVMYLANWGWNPTFTIGIASSQLAGGSAQYPKIKSVQRVNAGGWINIYIVDDPGRYAVGDAITVTGCADTTFNGNFTITGASRDPNAGLALNGPVIVVASALTTAVAQKADTGWIGYQSPGGAGSIVPKLIYPMNVVSRIVGTVVSLKRWGFDQPEPAWGDPYFTKTVDIAGDATVPVPTSGKCGIVANHLRGVNWMEYGDVTMTRL